jgi:hypothetical protein
MKTLTKLAIALVALAGSAIQTASAATVTVSDTGLNSGYMNVFDLPADGRGFRFGSPWGIADLRASFSNAGSTVTMLPNNVGDASTFWYIGGGAVGNPGNKIMEANLYNDAFSDTLLNQTLTFTGNVDTYSLVSGYAVEAFIKDFAADYSSFNIQRQVLNSTGAFTVSYAVGSATGRHIQYGFQMTGPNAWGSDADAKGSIVISAAVPEPSSASLIGLGVAGLLAFRLRRKV